MKGGEREMTLTERNPIIGQGEVDPKARSVIKEAPDKSDISEIGKNVRIPVSWDKGCRL